MRDRQKQLLCVLCDVINESRDTPAGPAIPPAQTQAPTPPTVDVSPLRQASSTLVKEESVTLQNRQGGSRDNVSFSSSTAAGEDRKLTSASSLSSPAPVSA